MVDKNTVKSMFNIINDMRKQIAELKGSAKVFNSKQTNNQILSCNADSVEFKKYDICKVIDGNKVAKFDGTESYSDDLLPGVVVGGNRGNSNADVLVLVSGISHVYVTEGVKVGQVLYPDSDDYTKAKLSGNVGYWKVMEDTEVDDYCKVSILGGGGGDTYEGYFKVTDATITEDGETTVQVSVTGGLVQINDEIREVESIDELQLVDEEYIILKSNSTQSVITYTTVMDYTTDEDKRLLATIEYKDGLISKIVQQNYGMPLGIILGEC